jgi:IS5 family transposase
MKHPSRPPKQLSFASYEFAQKKRVTRREKFLAEMEQVVPWSRLEALIEPLYPSAGRVGRQPLGVSRMLRMYCLQQWFSLSDEAVEDAIYDSQSMREFVGIDLARESVPDATTLLKFRRLLEEHELTRRLFDEIKAHLSEQGLLLREGTMVDATIIAAPPSTKNKAEARDPEMHQTKKGNTWHFGMKAHIDADTESGLGSTACTPRRPMKAMSRMLTKCCTARKRMRMGMPATPGSKSVRRLHRRRSKGSCARIFNGTWPASAARSSKWLRGRSRN